MNCTGLDLSSPNWWRIDSISCGDGWRPARSTAGSPDGSTLKITNVISVIMNSRKTTQISRRAMYAAIGLPRPRALGIQRVLHAVAHEVEREHGEQQRAPRREHVPPRRVEDLRGVGEHLAPRGLRRLDADAEERER